MSVGRAGGGAEGRRGSTDLSPQASINCLMCRRVHLTIQTESIWLWPWAVWRRMQTRRRGLQVPFVHQKYKKRKFLGCFVVAAAAAALRSEQGSRFWLLVPGPRQGFLWWLAKRWSWILDSTPLLLRINQVREPTSLHVFLLTDSCNTSGWMDEREFALFLMGLKRFYVTGANLFVFCNSPCLDSQSVNSIFAVV